MEHKSSSVERSPLWAAHQLRGDRRHGFWSVPLFTSSTFIPLPVFRAPFFAKISDLWHAYHVSTGTRHILLGQLHKKYGPLIRLGPNTISVNTDEGLQKIFSATSPIDKSPFYQALTPGFDSSFAAVGQAFKEKKSILSHAFAQKKLDAMETTFMKHTRKLCHVMATREEVELDDCLSVLTMDILLVSDVCFGETFYLLCNPAEKTRISKGFEYAAKSVSLFLDEIVTKAEGVFLCVHLFCTQLLQAMSRGDVVGDLRRILNTLPVQMENLYGHILDNLDLKDHAAKFFLLLQAILGRPDALIVSFVDDIGDDVELALRMPKKALPEAELKYRATELKKRFNSRCKGLLSLSTELLDTRSATSRFGIGTVQYCHRSAKDYLTMDSVQKKFLNMLDVPFDPHPRLCSAHLARWRCCTSNASDSMSMYVWNLQNRWPARVTT
ncbi:hypothetical protein INS49_005396 [Diaporthe citri]|uniref:uncharacterized protein n=1 Tax=Diaporthe citri TaxID=83186 RepID=UPI001C825A86|nr:uncharacterized protein INS49_005396 [Diaporthe citri]KAG6353687.1 hypothetical protein INS49_005396 [Diaporthe citri]